MQKYCFGKLPVWCQWSLSWRLTNASPSRLVVGHKWAIIIPCIYDVIGSSGVWNIESAQTWSERLVVELNSKTYFCFRNMWSQHQFIKSRQEMEIETSVCEKKNCRSKQTAHIMFWFHISELSTCISVRCLFTFRTDHRFRIYAHYLKWRLQLNEFISKVGVGAGRNKSRTRKYFLATITCFPFLFASLVFFSSLVCCKRLSL